MISTIIDPKSLRIALPMSLNSTTSKPLSPLPLKLQMKNGDGLFGARRESDAKGGLLRTHEGVDLDAPPNQKVFAVEGGIVIREGEIDGPNNRIIVIHHYPLDLGFISRYLHVKNPIVSTRKDNNEVEEGQQIAVVAERTPASHLHFEIRQLFTSPAPGKSVRDASLPIDPTMLLYELEIAVSTSANEHNEDVALISKIREDFRQGMRFITLEIENNSSQFFIPLYHPSASDLSLIRTVREAFFARKKIRIRWRDSLFFANIKTDSGSFAKMLLEAHVVP